jgi:hypothetical protein
MLYKKENIMKKILSIIVATSLLMPILGFGDDLANMDIKTAMDSMPDKVKTKLGNFKYVFGKNTVPVMSATENEVRVVGRTNAVFKNNLDSCNLAFYNALIKLKTEAEAGSATGVANIQSNWKDDITSSNTTFVCATGLLMSGVAFTGTAIK